MLPLTLYPYKNYYIILAHIKKICKQNLKNDKDSIEAEELEDMYELMIIGDEEKIEMQEATLLQDDLTAIFQLCPDIMEVSLDNIDMSNISIDKIVKESPTSEISFEGSEEYFEQLKSTEVNLSNSTKDFLALDDKQEGTEEESQPFGRVDFIKTKETIELVVNEQLKEEMRNYGIDMEQLLMPREEKDKNASLVEYKPRMWSKVISSIKNKLKQIQEGLFKRKNIPQRDEAEDKIPTEEQQAKKQKLLPSWDLKNWSPEELQFYEEQAKQEQREETRKRRKELEK